MRLNLTNILKVLAAVVWVFTSTDILAGTIVQYTMQPIINVHVSDSTQINTKIIQKIVTYIEDYSRIEFGNYAINSHRIGLNSGQSRTYSIFSARGASHPVRLKIKPDLIGDDSKITFQLRDGRQDTEIVVYNTCRGFGGHIPYSIFLKKNPPGTPVKFNYTVNFDYHYSSVKYYTATITDCSVTA